MSKTDLTKIYKTYYTAKNQPEIVHFETARYLSVCGKGDPSGTLFAEHIQALYSVAYSIKFQYKALDQDFTVSKLEGLWWYDEQKYAGLSIATSSVQVPRSEWEYRLLIRLPDYVDAGAVSNAAALVCAKKNIALASNVTFFELTEGKCVQMMHAGPFNTEPETLAQIGAFTQQHSFQKNGLHHEIYLSDFRNTAPEKLKTILREPVR